jgi:hypothetical protein
MDRELEINGNTVSVGEEKRYKYFLNGKTYYYTKDELRENLKFFHEKNDDPIDEDDLEFLLESEIELLEKYDGDPFGHLRESPKIYKLVHLATEKNISLITK